MEKKDKDIQYQSEEDMLNLICFMTENQVWFTNWRECEHFNVLTANYKMDIEWKKSQ